MFGTKLAGLDWAIIIGYTVIVVGIGLLFVRRGSKSVEAFFVSGHGLPWWLAGTSLVATTFACDTPLWVTDIVRQFGIQFAWLEWAPAWGLGVTLFITGRMLRKSVLVTDVQLAELRYGGKSHQLHRARKCPRSAGGCAQRLALPQIFNSTPPMTVAPGMGYPIRYSYLVLVRFSPATNTCTWGVIP